jgi:cell division protein ZipA
MSTKRFDLLRAEDMESILQTLTNDLRLALLLVGGLLLIVIVLWEVVQRRKATRADAAYLRGPLGQARSLPVDDLAKSDPLLEPLRRESRGPASAEFMADRVEPTLTLPEIHVRDRLVEPPLVDFDEAMSSEDRGNSIPVLQHVAPEVPAPVVESSGTSERSPAPAETERASPKVALPKDSEPVIVALRVVAREGERFSGAALRQALQGEGFVHGEMEIFHRALADGRVLMSAASLTKPGNFDLTTMDSMRYLGINLFAVLPGPIAGRDAVDKLLSVGHTLAQRLRGNLLDSRGEALSEARLAEMRREAAAAGGG